MKNGATPITICLAEDPSGWGRVISRDCRLDSFRATDPERFVLSGLLRERHLEIGEIEKVEIAIAISVEAFAIVRQRAAVGARHAVGEIGEIKRIHAAVGIAVAGLKGEPEAAGEFKSATRHFARIRLADRALKFKLSAGRFPPAAVNCEPRDFKIVSGQHRGTCNARNDKSAQG